MDVVSAVAAILARGQGKRRYGTVSLSESSLWVQDGGSVLEEVLLLHECPEDRVGQQSRVKVPSYVVQAAQNESGKKPLAKACCQREQDCSDAPKPAKESREVGG